VTGKTVTAWAARLPVSPAVLWTGIAVGVFLAVEAMVHGLVLPLSLGLLADATLTFLLIVALAVVLAELTRRHHRTLAGHAARHGRRAISYGRRQSAAGARLAGRHGRTVLAWLAAKARSRWKNREHRPLAFRRLRAARRPEPEPKLDPDGAEPAPAGPEEGPVYGTGEHISPQQGASEEGSPARAAPSPPTTEGSTAMPPSRISTEHRAQRAARTGAAGVPSEWGAVVGQTADFEPDSDAELLDWMARQVTGLSAWAEALVDMYEHCVAVIGIDPAASAMLHDVADAAAQAAETMGAAKAKFTQHYELPREFAANGGLMTHDGRWITGEGA
jgi:hypothetical protein